jgi:hypothetical protein
MEEEILFKSPRKFFGKSKKTFQNFPQKKVPVKMSMWMTQWIKFERKPSRFMREAHFMAHAFHRDGKKSKTRKKHRKAIHIYFNDSLILLRWLPYIL